MGIQIFRVVLGSPSGEREVRVPAKTEVQAIDAAVSLARSDESVLRSEVIDDDLQQVDTGLPGTQTHPDDPV